jgi:hypothetical protein
MDQNIQRPTTDGKHLTVAPEYPLANRKVKRAEPQLPVNYGAMHVCQPKCWISPARVCTENLSSGVVVVKSAKDGV